MKLVTSLRMAALAAATFVAASAPAALVYGGGTETTSRFNGNAAPGNSNTITWMNCFTTDVTGGGTLNIASTQVGIRRLTSAGALVDVSIEMFAAEMTFDGTNFGLGATTSLGTFALGGGTASLTQLVTSTTAASLALELASNPTMGGFWIGVRFIGPNFASTANGWRVMNAPTTGASINAFGLSDFTTPSSGFEGLFAFGTPPGASPSRFLVNVDGVVVPAPGAMALLGLAGLIARRRRA